MAYDFDKITDRKNTFAIKLDLASARNKPLDSIPLWVADMDFSTAPCVQSALKKAAEHGIFGYSRPDNRYYDALKNWFRIRHNFDFENEDVVNTPGVVFAIAAAIRAFTEKGDGVLIQKPVYYPFENAIKANERRVVNNPLVYKNGHYEIDFEDFEKKIVDEKVKLFIFCSPHNPGGRVWKKDELLKISQICLAHDVLVVADEIHSDIVFAGNQHTVYANLSKEAAQNSIICTSPSKTFNLAGLQFSNIIVKNKKLRLALKNEIDKSGYDEPNLMGIVAATAAYSDGAEWFDAVKEYIWQNVLFIEKYFAENCPKIKVVKPEGSYLVWLDFSAFTELSSQEISDRILNKAKVWLDDGTMFGSEGEKFERINAASPHVILQKAVEQISRAFSKE